MSNLGTAYGIIPPSGEFEENWPVNFNLPQGASGNISTGGWTADNANEGNFGNEGFIQQTFLGASIRNFEVNAGFGDSPSTMSISLVNDEYNKSDGTSLGGGDDPYHNGDGDQFLPPVVGTPVFFKFGKNPATIDQAFRQTYDDLYKIRTLPEKSANNAWGYHFPIESWNPEEFNKLEPYHLVDIVGEKIQDRSLLWNTNTYWRGRAHFNFGGILQSYLENKGPGGKPVYSVQLTDPREILSNVSVLLNNYQDTTFNYKNLINVYGFLEYDPPVDFLQKMKLIAPKAGIVDKFVNTENGAVSYIGLSALWDDADGWIISPSKATVNTQSRVWSLGDGFEEISIPGLNDYNLIDQYYCTLKYDGKQMPEFFPITGQGFSRRSDKGIPFYRVSQALAGLFQYYGELPKPYADAGFGGSINFRGYNYVVDFSGLPIDKIPLLYYMDFDEIDLLSFAQELCDITSHELYVSLLPIINHPACEFIYQYNNEQVQNGKPENIVAGIIRLDAIDKTKQPRYGAIKSYLDNLESRGITTENQDVGYELSNVTTDRFVVGGQQVDTYFFNTERDRDGLWTATRENNQANLEWLRQFQWDLRVQEQQQILPYYGVLGDNAVSIPRGFGSYQQILLDAKGLNAYGVGNYYVATELELRCALISYERWRDFLLSYNDVYIEDISEKNGFISALSTEVSQINKVMNDFKGRSGFVDLESSNAKDQIEEILNGLENREYAVSVPRCVWHSDKPGVTEDGYPQSPCSPPFGYPLYYRRAAAIGIPEAGIASIVNAKYRIVKDIENLKNTHESLDSPFLKQTQKSLQDFIRPIHDRIQEMVRSNRNDPYFKTTNLEYKALLDKLSELTVVWKNFQAMKANIEKSGGFIAQIEDINSPLSKYLFNIERSAKRSEQNARKVYDFVKKVADECLGKKFLVRLPKVCNVSYSKNISTFDKTRPFNIQNGPFGFPPRPISYNPNYLVNSYFDIITSTGNIAQSVRDQSNNYNSNKYNLWHHYLQDYQSDKDFIQKRTIGTIYNDGALKGNYNPFSETWEWNYKPEPQGGYFGYNVFGTNISALELYEKNVPWNQMPIVIQDGLAPIDPKNLTSESNRVQCYVRFNNSENLDFTNVNPQDMVQQVQYGGMFVPDIIEDLPNNNLDAKESFDIQFQSDEDRARSDKQPPSIAFVKCTLDEKIYMSPKLANYELDIYACEYDFTMNIPTPKLDLITNEDCEIKAEITYPDAIPIFSIPKDGGNSGKSTGWVDFKRRWDEKLQAWIVDTNTRNLDDEHAYALITIPGRIKSLVDSRWNDGKNLSEQAIQLKHLMTQDTVQIPAFSQPNIVTPRSKQILCGPPSSYSSESDALKVARGLGLSSATLIKNNEFGLLNGRWIPGTVEDWMSLSLENVSTARRNFKTIIDGQINQNPEKFTSYVQPSPVYPDIVALPLMSMERCYGPWLSASQLDPAVDPRIRYSDIGGKVEFIKDENLAPWNYAGYQLMNEAGYLQAQFSNSLLLFSERGGFVIPDAPTGIALATALQQEGPLITSIGINVSQDAGVKTTIKLDLYTSKWGKLAKQKEMAISQVARERKKLRDEKNTAIRNGFGKRQTGVDLTNKIMQAGGEQIMNFVRDVAGQAVNNKILGENVNQGVMVVGTDGAVQYNNTEDIKRVIDGADGNTTYRQLENNAIVTPSDIFTPFSSEPNSAMPSQGYNREDVINTFRNNENHQQ